MSCTIVVGGQFGSEGKGKVVALEAARVKAPVVVRCGGPNSGHTVDLGGRRVVLRQIPAGVFHPEARLMLAAGCVVDPDLLLAELDELELPRNKIVVDPRAILVSERDKDAEGSLVPRLASTASGTGSAIARRAQRADDVVLVGDCERLVSRVRIERVAPIVHEELRRGGDVLVEGTQGFGLSLLHGVEYPFVTARDTTASGFASEVGLSPRSIDRVVMVVRTFPIRVGGNSGPMLDETSWTEIQHLSGAPVAIPEYTSVTKRLRRVGHFDIDVVRAAARYNQPTEVAIMGLDRLDYLNTGVRSVELLTKKASDFIAYLTTELGVAVSWAGTGFGTEDVLLANGAAR
jgi:adenylosuccinate synthase